jgi:hypothetical protein
MKNWVRRIAIGLTVLLVTGALVAITGKVLGERKRSRVINVPVTAVPGATDTASLERGRYLYVSRGCTDCHHVHGGGREFINDPKGMRIVGPNITLGGPVAKYNADDWVRIIRHGVRANGRAAFIMPSEDYNRWTDAAHCSSNQHPTRCLRCQHVYWVPRPGPVGWKNSWRSTELARSCQPHARCRKLHGALSGCAKLCDHAALRQTRRRQRHPGDAL